MSRKSESAAFDKTLTFREHFGDYQRQLFLMDHAGLPLKTVLEQIDLLGEVVPVLRRELDALRPASVPDGPTHESLVAASVAAPDPGGTDLAGSDLARADLAGPGLAGPGLETSRR